MNENSIPPGLADFRVWRMLGLALSLLCGRLFVRVWLLYSATPLERFYFPTYVRLTLFCDLPSLPKLGHRAQNVKAFSVVFVGRYLATSDRLRASPNRLAIRDVLLRPEGFARYLRIHIYGGRTLAGVLRWPLLASELLSCCWFRRARVSIAAMMPKRATVAACEAQA